MYVVNYWAIQKDAEETYTLFNITDLWYDLSVGHAAETQRNDC